MEEATVVYENSTGPILDYDYCLDMLYAEPDSQFWRRSFVVVAFSAVESLAEMVADQVLRLHHQEASDSEQSLLEWARSLSPEVVFMLEGLTPRLDQLGQVRVVRYRASTEQRLLLLFRLIEKGVSISSKEGLDRDDWQVFKEVCVPLRNRIVHPRGESFVGTDELDAFRGLMSKLTSKLISLMDDLAELTLSEVERLNASTAELERRLRYLQSKGRVN